MKGVSFIPVFVGLLVAASVVCVAVYAMAGHYLTGQSPANSNIVQCPNVLAQHTVLIQQGHVQPVNAAAHACDRLVIINNDEQLRNIAFGTHEHHVPYNGVTETVLEKGQRVSVVLNQVGTFRFHDHFQDGVQGTFTVSR